MVNGRVSDLLLAQLVDSLGFLHFLVHRLRVKDAVAVYGLWCE